MRGDRFKKRLPKYIGQIADMDDTFFAEDKEFYRIEEALDDFLYGLIASLLDKTKNPSNFLKKFETDYGLESIGEIDDRLKQVLLKIGAKKVTTEEVILDICKAFGLPGVYHEKYKEYAFLLELYIKGGDVDLGKLHAAIREVTPAHLEDRVNINFVRDLKLKSQSGNDSYKVWLCGEHPCGDIPYTYAIGQGSYIDLKAKSGLYNSENYYGYAPKGGLIIMRDDKNREFRYVQDMSSDRRINFGGKDD